MPWKKAARPVGMLVIALLGVLVAALITYLMREPILYAVGDYLVVQDDLQQADLIHVLSGPDQRADYGIWLYQKGYGKRLFFTGGWYPDVPGNRARRGQEQALAQGVPAQAVIADGFQVTSTYSEAVRLKAFLAASPEPVHSVIIVSDPFHMRRARLAYSWVFGNEVNLQMAPVPFDLSSFQRRWWADEGSRSFVRDEYLKLAYYYLRYRLGAWPLQEWLASLDRE